MKPKHFVALFIALSFAVPAQAQMLRMLVKGGGGAGGGGGGAITLDAPSVGVGNMDCTTTTAAADETVVLITLVEASGGGGIPSASDSGGHTWTTARGWPITDSGTAGFPPSTELRMFTSPHATAVTGEVITPSFGGSGIDSATFMCFALAGVNAVPMDTHMGLPTTAVVTSGTGGYAANPTTSTTTNPFFLYIQAQVSSTVDCSSPPVSPSSGFTAIATACNTGGASRYTGIFAQYKIDTSAESAASATASSNWNTTIVTTDVFKP